jgi:hypothetical protein
MPSKGKGAFMTLSDQEVAELLTCLRELIENCRLHSMDYHHVTPPGLLVHARALLQRLEGES